MQTTIAKGSIEEEKLEALKKAGYKVFLATFEIEALVIAKDESDAQMVARMSDAIDNASKDWDIIDRVDRLPDDWKEHDLVYHEIDDLPVKYSDIPAGLAMYLPNGVYEENDADLSNLITGIIKEKGSIKLKELVDVVKDSYQTSFDFNAEKHEEELTKKVKASLDVLIRTREIFNIHSDIYGSIDFVRNQFSKTPLK